MCIRDRASPCAFHHPERKLRVVVHGDDFLGAGREKQLNWLRQVMNKSFEAKHVMMGPKEYMSNNITLLGRSITWGSDGLVWEADQRHAKLVINALGLEHDKPSKTPAEREDDDAADEDEGSAIAGVKTVVTRKESAAINNGIRRQKDEELSEDLARAFKSIAARLNYLAADRPDI
eukprot:8677845-Karenia_brevis.AAC.1